MSLEGGAGDAVTDHSFFPRLFLLRYMRRRQLLSALAVGLGGSLAAGCLGAPSGDVSSLAAAGGCARQGERVTVRFRVRDVSRLLVRPSEALAVQYEDLSTRPDPWAVVDSLPPQYRWRGSVAGVVVRVPVRVPDATPPGSYALTVRTDRVDSPHEVPVTVGDCEDGPERG